MNDATCEAPLLGRLQPKVALRSEVLTQREPLTSVLEAYEAFDTRQPGWIKVKLEPVPVTA